MFDPNAEEVYAVIETFLQQFDLNAARIADSGALSGDEHPVMVAKCLLFLTAEDMKPMSDEGRELLENLSHF